MFVVPLRDDSGSTYVAGSRVRDLVVAAAILIGMLLLAPRLRVYYQVTVVDVAVASVAPDGTRTALPTPAEFRKVGAGYWRGDTVVAQLKPKIDAYMTAGRSAGTIPERTRYEWTIRWSDDSLALNHVEQIVWEAPAR